MALMKKTQRSFVGGQIDKDLTGRQDLNRYSQGCLALENFKVRKQGNVIKRAGTDLVCDFSRCLGNLAADAIGTARLVPLIQERESGYYMLFTGRRAFLVSPAGMRMTNGTWDPNPIWSAGASWTADNAPSGHGFSAQPTFDPSAGTWSWTDTAGTTWTADGTAKDVRLTFSAQPTVDDATATFDATFGDDASHTAPYSIAIPFDDNDLAMIDWCQSGDTVFFAHRTYPPCKIVYCGSVLAYERLQFRQGLGTPPTISAVTQSGSGWTGTGGTIHLEYAVTAVKDGVETGMSVPYAVDYNAPWPTTGSYVITIDTSALEPGSWDCFYIYKKEADVFGLIGTTSSQTAFVSVADGFSVSGDNYPSGFSTFDKTVHLRESGNKFASVHEITDVTVWNNVLNYEGYYAVYASNIPKQFTYVPDDWEYFTKNGGYTETGATTRSSTAQKASSASCVFSIPSVSLSSIQLRIGSIKHSIQHSTTWVGQTNYVVVYDDNPAGWQEWCLGMNLISSTEKWTGQHSEFSACPARFFKATVEYQGGDGNWVTSEQFDCAAVVDQTNPGSGWTAVSGSPNKWRKTYSETDSMWSYTDAATVIARMDANSPAVGATVDFAVPAEAAGKKIRKITVYGFAGNDAGAAAADLIVNGIACYQDGQYVNTFTDGYYTPDLTITPPKVEDHFVNPGDYPGCVQLYGQRLVYAASANHPFTFWMSCTGDLYNFDSHEYIRASDAITASTAALEMPRINRMLVHRDLMLFAEGGEWQVAPSAGNAVAPSTIAAKLQSTIGCASWLKPIPVDSDIIFCDSSGETLMATRYNFATDGYESSNLSVLSQRIFRNNAIRSMAYVQFPESTIECVLSDGTIASLVYMKEHEVCAWSRHVLGGSWKAIDVAANKSVVNGSSSCAFLAKRTYDVKDGDAAATRTEWAVLAVRDIDPNGADLLGNLRMDAVRSVTVARTGSDVCAVDETEPPEIAPPSPGHGETVVKVGEVREETDGIAYVTGDVYAVGCAFTSSLKTTSPEFTDQETAQMEIKNATESEVRVIDGSDFTVRQPEVPSSKATLMKVPCTVNKTGKTYTLVPGDADCRLPLVGTNTTNGSVVIEHDSVLPLAILSVSTAFRIEYSNHANGGSGNGRG